MLPSCRLFAAGRIAHSPEARLEAHYLKMLSAHVTRIEVNSAAKLASITRQKGEKMIALVPNGQSMSTIEFSKRLGGEWKRSLFLVGGPEGLSRPVEEKAEFCLSLSPMVFSHFLARLILLEQLWRALSIQRNHPYHR